GAERQDGARTRVGRGGDRGNRAVPASASCGAHRRAGRGARAGAPLREASPTERRRRRTLMVRDIVKALRETILLSQRVEAVGTQVAALARTSREELGKLRDDVVALRERVTRVEAFLDAAKMFAERNRLEPPAKG